MTVHYSRRQVIRGAWVAGVAATGAAWLGACATPANRGSGRVYRVGWLAFGPAPTEAASNFDTFRNSLRELGYVEGQNLVIERRLAPPDDGRFPQLAAELVALPVDVLVASATPPIRAAKDATRTVPIVMAVANGDPVAAGLVDSLARPGGNVTGLTMLSPMLSGKRLELLLETVPGTGRVAVLGNLSLPDVALDWAESQQAAQALGVQLTPLDIRRADELPGAFDRATQEGAQALATLADPLMLRNRAQIVELAARARLPGIYTARAFVDEGGLMSYGPRFQELFRRAAVYVDKILKGTRPAELPVEQPSRFELVVNLKAAEAIGLTVPRPILVDATDVIQ